MIPSPGGEVLLYLDLAGVQLLAVSRDSGGSSEKQLVGIDFDPKNAYISSRSAGRLIRQ